MFSFSCHSFSLSFFLQVTVTLLGMEKKMTRRLSNNSHVFSMLVVPALAATTNAARALVRTRVITVAILAVLGLSLVACGGSSSKSSTPTPTAVAVTTNVSAATVSTTGTMTFTASVTGSSNTAVTWSVQEANGGTITQAGVYTPPAKAGTYHVVATSQADPTKVATIAVTVTATAVVVTTNVSTATVSTAGTVTFTASVTGSSNTAVTWSVQEANGGTITQAGVYTPPSIAGTYHVLATSQADPTKVASITVTVTAAIVGITITPASGPYYATLSYQFSANVTGSLNTAVTWSVQEGASGGTISATGLYTAPAKAGTYHVIATSQADATKSASAAVAITIPSPTFTSTPNISPTLAQGATYTYAITANDPAGTTITYKLTTGPATASISGKTLTWTPLTLELQMPTSFVVTATTALGGTNTQPFTVTPLRTVTMTLIDNLWTAGGQSTSPVKGTSPVGALVPGSAKLIPGTDNGDGTYTINNVPAGYYWLVDGPVEKYYTNVNTFYADTDFIGQMLSAPTTAQPIDITALPLDATASPNVSSNDVIWIGSPNTTAWWAPQGPSAGTPLPTTGVSLTDTTESIAPGTLPAINSGTPGDPSYILQFSVPSSIISASPLSYVGMSIAADYGLGTGFNYTNLIGGGAEALTASTPETLSFTTKGWGSLVPSVTYTLSGGTTTPRLVYFGTYLASMPYITPGHSAIGGGYPSCSGSTNPANTTLCTEVAGLVGWPAYTSAAPDSALLSIPHGQNTREAGNDAGPLFMAYAALDSPTCTSSQTTLCTPPDNDTVSMPVDNSFGSTPMVLSSQVEVQVPLGFTKNFSLVSTSQISVTRLSSAIPDQPVIYPVTAPLINGGDLYTSPSTTLSAPLTLSWAAATLNSAVSGAKLSGYDVIVYAVPSGSDNWGAAITDLYTTSTSLTIPTGLLSAGSYVFVIEARADALAVPSVNPWHSQFPRGTAQVVSAPMTISGS